MCTALDTMPDSSVIVPVTYTFTAAAVDIATAPGLGRLQFTRANILDFSVACFHCESRRHIRRRLPIVDDILHFPPHVLTGTRVVPSRKPLEVLLTICFSTPLTEDIM